MDPPSLCWHHNLAWVSCIVNTIEPDVIRIRLREAIEEHARRGGGRLSYGQLADLAGLSRAAVESIAARPGYNPTLDVVDRLCGALGCSIAELLERVADP